MIIKHISIITENFHELDNKNIQSLLNNEVANRWDYLKWFLSLHYKFNQKIDSPFWLDCREKTDTSDFDYLLDIYKNHGPLNDLNIKLKESLTSNIVDSLFGLEGIDYILMGQNILPNTLTKYKKISQNLWQFNLDIWKETSKRSIPMKKVYSILKSHPDIIY